MIKLGVNSYFTIEYVDDHIKNIQAKKLWNALSSDDKENYVIFSTSLFDNFGWIGKRLDELTQELEFPRLYGEEKYGGYFQKEKFRRLSTEIRDYMTVSESKVTTEQKKCIIKIIEGILTKEVTEDNQALVDLQNAGVKSFSAGSLEFEMVKVQDIDISPVIRDTRMWYFTKVYWNRPIMILERA
jgi:hypothetical protein